MSLNSIIRWLKPREMVFFDLLEASAENLCESIRYFNQELQAGDPSRWADMRHRMKDLEHKGDEITHEIIERLDLTFVTPIERDDILALAHSLDDVVDCLYAVSERLTLYKITHVHQIAKEMTRLLPDGGEEIVHLIRALRSMSDIPEIRRHIRAVTELENQSDVLYHAGLAELFEECQDAIHIMKWREILGLLEDAADRIELVAKVVGSTVMRNA